MARTVVTDVFNPETLEETVQGRFAQKNAFMGSLLARAGAVVIRPNFDESDPNRIGSTIKIPYFGTLGEFQPRTDGSPVNFNAIGQMTEDATVGCDALGFEVTRWAQFGATPDRDPYEESAEQIAVAAERAADKACVAASSASPLLLDAFSLTSPRTLDSDLMVDGQTSFWGDDMEDIVAAVVHSRTKADLRKLKDANGNPQLVARQNDGDFDRFCGVPLITSDKAPLTGSSMAAVVSAGTSPPAVTLAVSDVTKLGPWDLQIEITTLGASNGTAKFRFKVKGNIYSAIYTVPSGGGAFVLDDSFQAAVAPSSGVKTKDSLVGYNGLTGITATFANGTYAVDNVYTSKARLKVETQLFKRAACAYWFNGNALRLLTDGDISRDSRLAAMHLYRAAHMYRRTRFGNLPGVVRVAHNVSGYL